MTRKIAEITDVTLTILRTDPPTLHISARGRAPTSGWSNPQLDPYVYITFPADGVQEFDFDAQPPPNGAIVMPVFTPLEASISIQPVPKEWKGVRVHATLNSMETKIEEAFSLKK
jgi:hypothetical protein